MTSCATGDGRDVFLHGFCATCWGELGYEGRRLILFGTRGISKRVAIRRAVERLEMKYTSVKNYGGGSK